MLVTEGQQVSRGDPLLEIEPSPETNLQIQQARNDYESAKKALEYMQQRFDLKLTTNDQLLQAKQALEQAQAKLESMRRRGSESPQILHADVTSLISKLAVQEGAIVAAGNPLIEMVAQTRLEARLGVEPEDSDKVKPGQEVSLARVNVPGPKSIVGRIRKISRAADATTRLVQVFTELPSTSKFLLGEYVLGKVPIGSADGLIVPRSAVLPEEDHYVLFTVKDGHAQEHTVRVDLENETDVEVIANDLHPGEPVVTLGNYELKDGMAVKVDLQGTENRRPSQLSGGQQQRVALARTLVIQPRLLLLDEPLSNLDAKLRIDMRIELLKLQRDLGLTTIYVTHDQEEALALSTRIAVMNRGRVIQEGASRQIYEQPANEFVAAFVGKSNLFSGRVLQADERFIEVQTDDNLILRSASSASAKLPETGDAVLLSVRPEAMELKAACSTPTGPNQLTGHVAASAYQGSFVEYEIQLAERTLKTYAVNPKGKALFQRGDEVAVTFAADDVVIVRND